jgi:hypothetical protein
MLINVPHKLNLISTDIYNQKWSTYFRVRQTPKISILLYVLLSICCKDKYQSCPSTIETVLKDNKVDILYSDTTEGSNQEISDVGIKDMRGSYEFFDNGLLKSYDFIVKRDSSNFISPTAELIEADPSEPLLKSYSSYTELYDSIGKILKVWGNPLVYKHIKIIKDSVNMNLYFFTVNKEYGKFEIVNKLNQPYKFIISADTTFSNMKRLTLNYKSKAEKRFTAFINVNYKSMCENDNYIIRDTIDFEF